MRSDPTCYDKLKIWISRGRGLEVLKTPEHSNSGKPVEALLAPERLAKIVGDLDCPNPLRVLVAELGRSSQPQRIAERISEDLIGVFSGEDRLRMQRSRHVDAFGVIVVTDKIDVFCRHIRADAFQKIAQISGRADTRLWTAVDTPGSQRQDC